MGFLFSKHKVKESRITEQDKAVLQLKQQRDKLKIYQKKIMENLEKERQVAKQLLQEGKKEKAKLLLRKKKFMDQMLQKTDVQLMNLEQMVHDLEYAQVELKIVEGLKVGNEALKKIHQMLSIEDIERIMEETQEGIEIQREIDELVSGRLTDEDEDAVLAELDAIVAESIPSPPATIEEEDKVILPDVPMEEPAEAAKEKKKQRELVAAS